MGSRVVTLVNKVLKCLPPPACDLAMISTHDLRLIPQRYQRGGGDPVGNVRIGDRVVELIAIHVAGALRLHILEAGCGDGRIAAGLVRHPDFTGTYAGFDINRNRMDHVMRVFAAESHRFRFRHLDLFHSYYNPGGRQRAEDIVYPFGDGEFDLVFYNSIFSHLDGPVIRRSLAEARRVLSACGRVWMTAYAVDDEEPVTAGTFWNFSQPYGEGLTATPDNPEGCVAFMRSHIERWARDSGFGIEKYVPGYWKNERRSLDQHEQDIFVLRKA